MDGRHGSLLRERNVQLRVIGVLLWQSSDPIEIGAVIRSQSKQESDVVDAVLVKSHCQMRRNECLKTRI